MCGCGDHTRVTEEGKEEKRIRHALAAHLARLVTRNHWQRVPLAVPMQNLEHASMQNKLVKRLAQQSAQTQAESLANEPMNSLFFYITT